MGALCRLGNYSVGLSFSIVVPKKINALSCEALESQNGARRVGVSRITAIRVERLIDHAFMSFEWDGTNGDGRIAFRLKDPATLVFTGRSLPGALPAKKCCS